MQVRSVTSTAPPEETHAVYQIFKRRIVFFQAAPALLATLAALVICALGVSFSGRDTTRWGPAEDVGARSELSAPEIYVDTPQQKTVRALNRGWQQIFAAQLMRQYVPMPDNICVSRPNLCAQQEVRALSPPPNFGEANQNDIVFLHVSAQRVARQLFALRGGDSYVGACLSGVWMRHHQLPSGSSNPMLVARDLGELMPLSSSREKHRRAFARGYGMGQVFDCGAFGD